MKEISLVSYTSKILKCYYIYYWANNSKSPSDSIFMIVIEND